jgi:hypothetical protein
VTHPLFEMSKLIQFENFQDVKSAFHDPQNPFVSRDVKTHSHIFRGVKTRSHSFQDVKTRYHSFRDVKKGYSRSRILLFRDNYQNYSKPEHLLRRRLRQKRCLVLRNQNSSNNSLRRRISFFRTSQKQRLPRKKNGVLTGKSLFDRVLGFCGTIIHQLQTIPQADLGFQFVLLRSPQTCSSVRS